MPESSFPSIDFAALGRVPLFHGLPLDLLKDISQAAQPLRIEKGGFAFMQGDPAKRLYLLVAGRLKMTQMNAEGQQSLLRLIGPYQPFGLVVLGHAESYPVNAEALEPSAALGWEKLALMQFLPRDPAFAINAIQVMAAHTQEFQERFRQMATEKVEQRLARTLLRLAAQSGRKVEEGVLIDFPLTRQELGEMAGTTLYTASRLLSQWESQGLVISGREGIIIRYPHGLIQIAGSL